MMYKKPKALTPGQWKWLEPKLRHYHNRRDVFEAMHTQKARLQREALEIAARKLDEAKNALAKLPKKSGMYFVLVDGTGDFERLQDMLGKRALELHEFAAYRASSAGRPSNADRDHLLRTFVDYLRKQGMTKTAAAALASDALPKCRVPVPKDVLRVLRQQKRGAVAYPK